MWQRWSRNGLGLLCRVKHLNSFQTDAIEAALALHRATASDLLQCTQRAHHPPLIGGTVAKIIMFNGRSVIFNGKNRHCQGKNHHFLLKNHQNMLKTH